MTQPEIYTWATSGFSRFKDIWEFDDFWTRGNTFDACLRFVVAAKTRWPEDPKIEEMAMFVKKKMIVANHDYLSGKLSDPGIWADDFGWWGIACLTTRDYLLSLGETSRAAEYLTLAKKCWEQMKERGYDASPTAKPVPHGCKNSPSADVLGAKNTVTNANLFVLSLRLYNSLKTVDKPVAGSCLEMAYKQYLWFSEWFKSPYGYLRVISSFPAALLQERPIAKPDYEDKEHPRWQAGWIWSGDQGLILGALIGILEIREDLHDWVKKNHVPNFDPAVFEKEVVTWIKMIVSGIKVLLFGWRFADTDYVLREAPFNSSFVADPKDYVCGRGVLLRYLSAMSTASFVTNQFNEGITRTAKALWNGRDQTNNQFGAQWNKEKDLAFNQQFVKRWGNGDPEDDWTFGQQPEPPCNGILQATGLDVLGAAIPILG